MSDWKKYFKKAGGFQLLKKYLKNHLFFTALNQFCILGSKKKALELLRLTIEYKFLNRVKSKDEKIIRELTENVRINHKPSEVRKSKLIWICWWQGIENAPELVRKCFNSICRYFPDWDIKVVTQNNYNKYINFPQNIIDKWNMGVITHTHMSDLLRLELLIRHGGLWLDSTILATSSEIPKSIIESDLFFYRTLKPGADGHAVLLSSWLIFATSNNCILTLTRDLLYNYWEKANALSDYFLLHYYMTIACEQFKDEFLRIPQFSNEIPHILLLNLFNKFDISYLEDVMKMSCFHKLSYKYDPDMVTESKGTYYEWIINNY